MNNLEIKFKLEQEKRYLQKNPTEAIELALEHLEDFLNLSRKMRDLEQELKTVTADNEALISQMIKMSKTVRVTLPSFLDCQSH